MSAIDFPEIDSWGHNVTASTLLDEHHDVIGWSGFGDDLIDNCEVCWFAAGWTEPADMNGRDHFGHATAAGVEEVQKWIDASGNGRTETPGSSAQNGSEGVAS